MRGKLARRLQQYRELQGEHGARAGQGQRREREEEAASAGRAAFLRERGWKQTAEKVWEKSEEQSLSVFPSPGGVFLPGGDDAGGYRFFDFETTGLSGGAGTYIFLAGFGRYLPEKGMIRVERQLLEDLDGEPQFLSILNEKVDPELHYVSYNGKGYDRHVLRSRALLHGVKMSMPYQIDLLYPVRRIWKADFENCRLQTAERELLGKQRIDDIPGSQIPDCYFRFLKAEDFGCMERVIVHHVQDIVSLAELAGYMERSAEEPELLGSETARAGLGRILLQDRPERGRELLRRAFDEGSVRAGKLLALSLRREKRYDEMAAVLERMWQRRRGLFQGEALAKYYEHRLGRPERALAVVREMLERMRYIDASARKALLHRLRRLERKCGER
jgi:hypothetical protein